MRKLLVPALVLVALLAAPAEARNPSFPAPLNVSAQGLSDSQYWPDDPSFSGRWDLWAWTPTACRTTPTSPTWRRPRASAWGSTQRSSAPPATAT